MSQLQTCNHIQWSDSRSIRIFALERDHTVFCLPVAGDLRFAVAAQHLFIPICSLLLDHAERCIIKSHGLTVVSLFDALEVRVRNDV